LEKNINQIFNSNCNIGLPTYTSIFNTVTYCWTSDFDNLSNFGFEKLHWLSLICQSINQSLIFYSALYSQKWFRGSGFILWMGIKSDRPTEKVSFELWSETVRWWSSANVKRKWIPDMRYDVRKTTIRNNSLAIWYS